MIPKSWTVVGLTLGRGNYKNKLTVSRVAKNQKPLTVTLNSDCSCSLGEPIENLIETVLIRLNPIMRANSETMKSG